MRQKASSSSIPWVSIANDATKATVTFAYSCEGTFENPPPASGFNLVLESVDKNSPLDPKSILQVDEIPISVKYDNFLAYSCGHLARQNGQTDIVTFYYGIAVSN